jgi:hypothetical protein
MFQEFTHGDIFAQIIIGGGSIVAMIFLWRHCDSLSDGNVGGEPDNVNNLPTAPTLPMDHRSTALPRVVDQTH